MSKRLGLVLAVAAIVAGGWAFHRLVFYISRGGEHTPIYSIRRYDPYGTAALYRLLDERGATVSTLERPRLDGDAAGVLVQVLAARERGFWDRDDPAGDAYDLPASELAEWIAAGNTVIQMARHHTPLMRQLGVPAARQPSELSDLQAHQRRGGGPTDQPGRMHWARAVDAGDHRQLGLWMPQRFGAADRESRWRPLWRAADARADEDDAVLVGELRHGEGRLIVIGAPTPALNHALPAADHLEIVLELVGDGPVIFDEWSHGVGHIGTVMELLRDFGLLPVLGQIVLVILVYHWATRGHRRVDEPEPPRRRASIEQVQTLGHLYRQGLDVPETAQRVAEEVRRRLARAWRCAPDRLEQRLAADRTPADAQARALLHDAEALAQRAGAQPTQRTMREMTGLLSASSKLAATPHKRRSGLTSESIDG